MKEGHRTIAAPRLLQLANSSDWCETPAWQDFLSYETGRLSITNMNERDSRQARLILE
jgi:hypothetical protein